MPNLETALEILCEVSLWSDQTSCSDVLLIYIHHTSTRREKIYILHCSISYLRGETPAEGGQLSPTLPLLCLRRTEGSILWGTGTGYCVITGSKQSLWPWAASWRTRVWAQFMIYNMKGFLIFRPKYCNKNRLIFTPLKTNRAPPSTFTDKAGFGGVKRFLRRFVLTRVTVFASSPARWKKILFRLVQRWRRTAGF